MQVAKELRREKVIYPSSKPYLRVIEGGKSDTKTKKRRVRKNLWERETFIYFVVFVLTAVSLYAGSLARNPFQNKDYQLKEVKIGKGTTLWKLAETYAPKNSDYRLFIEEVEKINGLSSSTLSQGKVIKVPAYK